MGGLGVKRSIREKWEQRGAGQWERGCRPQGSVAPHTHSLCTPFSQGTASTPVQHSGRGRGARTEGWARAVQMARPLRVLGVGAHL